jgi:sugar/nucleoside kinase (ribokinase family)
LGKQGCRWKGCIYAAFEVEVFDLCGAGDSFLAALVYKYLETNCIMESIMFANDMASQVVQKRGVVACFSRTNGDGEEELVKKINA